MIELRCNRTEEDMAVRGPAVAPAQLPDMARCVLRGTQVRSYARARAHGTYRDAARSALRGGWPGRGCLAAPKRRKGLGAKQWARLRRTTAGRGGHTAGPVGLCVCIPGSIGQLPSRAISSCIERGMQGPLICLVELSRGGIAAAALRCFAAACQ